MFSLLPVANKPASFLLYMYKTSSYIQYSSLHGYCCKCSYLSNPNKTTASPFTRSQSVCYNISWLEAVTSWSHGGLSFIYVFKFFHHHMNDAGWDSSLTFISDSYGVTSLYISCCAVYQVTLHTQVRFLISFVRLKYGGAVQGNKAISVTESLVPT